MVKRIVHTKMIFYTFTAHHFDLLEFHGQSEFHPMDKYIGHVLITWFHIEPVVSSKCTEDTAVQFESQWQH